ncbi:unnamed protein product [Discula destructiva]
MTSKLRSKFSERANLWLPFFLQPPTTPCANTHSSSSRVLFPLPPWHRLLGILWHGPAFDLIIFWRA